MGFYLYLCNAKDSGHKERHTKHLNGRTLVALLLLVVVGLWRDFGVRSFFLHTFKLLSNNAKDQQKYARSEA